MSLLSGLLKKLKDEVEKKADELSDVVSSMKEQEKPSSAAPAAVSVDDAEPASFYDAVPAEENQYNFGGTFLEYFDKVFHEEFPDHTITREELRPGRSYVYTFMIDGRTALKAELMSEDCSANKFRKDCLTSGIPYVRFYFDHEGWWNTRAYVVERTRRAMNG